MNRLILFLGALLLSAAGCDREPCSLCSEEPVPRHLQLRLSGCVLETKSTEVPSLSDSHVVRCLLYVFNPAGMLVNCLSSASGRFDLELPDGTYDFVAVANKGGLPMADMTRQELMETVSSLDENAPGNFVMTGLLDSHSVTADEELTIELQRFAGKVSCVVHTAFVGALKALPFVVEEVFLTNVAGSGTLWHSGSTPPAEAVWFNRMDREDAGPADLLYHPVGQRLGATDSLVMNHCFYAYPNQSADSHDKERWGSRCTRLVVKASLNGQTVYYPVTLAYIRSNHHYHVDLTLSNYGLSHPEDRPDDYAGFQVSVSVVSWESGASLQGTY